MDIFWIYNPSILFERYYEIVPTNDMTRTRQKNTISRLIFYTMILSLIFSNDNLLLLVCLSALILIIIFYFINKYDSVGIEKDIIKQSKNEVDEYTDNNINNNRNNLINESIDKIYNSYTNSLTKDNKKNIILEAGYIDSDGNYRIGKDYSLLNNNKNNKKEISYENNKIYVDNTCRKPTADNPFANIVFADYLDAANIPEPCNTDDENIKNEMSNLYNSTIYRNYDDVFERENSQRNFYTMPITSVPNKQTEFANWLYKTPPTCKENSNNCTYYEEPYMVSPRY